MKPARVLIFSSLLIAILLLAAGIALWQTPTNEAWFHLGQYGAGMLPDTLWASLTILGTGAVAYALLTPALLLRQPRWLAAALCALPFATIATHVPKNLLTSDRPAGALAPEQVHVIGEVLRHSSFPSGHSLTAFAFAAVVILLSQRPLRASLIAMPLATLIAFSRIAVGAHWPADALAGAGLGWLCGACGVWLALRWRGWNKPTGIRIMALLMGATSASLFFTDLGYPLALMLQYAIGVIGVLASLMACIKPPIQAHA